MKKGSGDLPGALILVLRREDRLAGYSSREPVNARMNWNMLTKFR